MVNAVERKTYRICSNCVMDTSDSSISFDEKGVCDYCNTYYGTIQSVWRPKEDRGD